MVWNISNNLTGGIYMPAISVLMKPSSSLCNMSCDYCFYCDEAQKRTHKSYGFMTEETLKNVIRKTLLRAEGYISYAYQGGEPTLRGLDFYKQAIAFQKQYNKNNITISNSFQTNGYLLDKEWCKFFHENHFLVGLSIDGTREIHNIYRRTANNEDTFDRVVASAKLMDQYQVDYNILTVVTPQIAAHIRTIYSFYQKKGWNYQQYIACLDPLNEPHGNNPHSLSPEVYGQFLIDLFELWYSDLQQGKQPFIRQFENYVAIAMGYYPESCEQRGFCGIQNVVEADGSVYPCDFYVLDEYFLGNFNTDRIDVINQHRVDSGFIECSQKLDSNCKCCKYYPLCRGGCQRNRDYNKTSNSYQNYYCKSYQMFFQKNYTRIMDIADKIAKNRRTDFS